ncbi:MAG: hypothetical protein Q8934_11320 [Bacillota bacterium]|nr:hypothetical protein [Bacillota bacterium]
MNVVQRAFQMSQEFYEEMNKPFPKSERDQLILKIQGFLSKREDLLKEMKGPYTPEEQQLGKQIIQYNQLIQEKFKFIQEEIKHDFLTTKNQKRNTPKYMNPYPVVNDGVFYDKRK